MNRFSTTFSTGDVSCSLFPSCPGCKLQKKVRNPPIWQEIIHFFQKCNQPIFPDLVSFEILGWRSKVKLAVRGTSALPLIGLFEEDSHRVVDLQECPMHYPLMNQALLAIRREVVLFGIEPYEEKKGTKGRLRYLQMVIQRSTGKIQLSLVWNAKTLEEKEVAFLHKLSTLPFWHSIWVNYLEGSTNTIFGPLWQLFWGEEDFVQEICQIPFSFHPAVFSQNHLSVFEEMLRYIDTLVLEKSSLLELYAGVGCIGLFLAKKASSVTLVESSPFAKNCFEKTLVRLPPEEQKKCHFFQTSVEEDGISLKGADLILVDPPRKGLSKLVKKKIFSSTAKKVIYVSCGPLSFMRDCLEFLDRGWSINQAKGFLLFPGTDHVEIVALFEKTTEENH